MSAILQDLRYGCRLLLRSPGFTALVLLILALGIGATSAIFSVVNAVLLRPAPFRDPGRVFNLTAMNVQGEGRGAPAAGLRAFLESEELVEKAAFWYPESLNATGPEGPENLYGILVSADCFDLLGTPPVLGRTFRPDEFRPGAPGAVILSDRLWQRRYGRNPGVIGRELLLNGKAHAIVGVMPPDFVLPAIPFELWTAWQRPAAQAAGSELTIVRLKPGITPEQAQARANEIFRASGESGAGEFRTSLRPLGRGAGPQAGAMLLVFLGAVGFVLLIACLNVASLLLARGAGRTREVAVRAALGAGRGRLLRQLLVESLLLACLGGVAGLAVSAAASRALVAIFPEQIPIPGLEQTRLDGTVLLFTLLLCLATGIIFGLVPALRTSRANLNEALKEGGRSAVGRSGSHRLRSMLVIAETALSLVLLAGAGLMLRSMDNLLRVEKGFNPDRLLTLRVPLPPEIKEQPRQAQYVTRMLERVRVLPGVAALGMTTVLPLGDSDTRLDFAIPGRQAPLGRGTASVRAVSAGYFRAMGIVVRRGRVFNEGDGEGAPPVAVISDTMARRFFPGEDPVGLRIHLLQGSQPGPALTIIGVVNDVRYKSVVSEGRSEVYRDYRQYLSPAFSTTLTLRTHAGDPMRMAAAVEKQIRAIYPDQSIRFMRSMRQVIAESLSLPRFFTLLSGTFALCALVLAAAGLYGVLSYSVTRRAHEFGIRMALGASRQAVARQVVGQALLLVAVGVALGLAGALALTRMIGALLYHVKPNDPLTFGGVSALLLAVALVASYVPARRAMAVDPAAALRCE